MVTVTEIIRPGPGFSYNRAVGEWWLERSANRSHRRAYVNIANFIRRSIRGNPRLIVDYACGAGNLLSLLCRRFPNSHLIGLDGSSLLLSMAGKRLLRLPRDCTRRISLIETTLPRPISPRRRANLVVFSFPNMVRSGAEEKRKRRELHLSREDQEIARRLSRAREPGVDARDLPDPRITRRTLEYGRSVSRNLRDLLIRGGFCVRAEYATTRRHEWSQLELLCASFEEGSLDEAVAGIHPVPWFRVLASAYFSSRVLEDVYQQTGDERDTGGGYLITVLRAI